MERKDQLEVDINEYLDYLRNIKRYSEFTVENYARDLKSFKKYLDDDGELSYLNVDKYQIRDYISLKMQNNSLKNRSLNRHLSSLRGFYSYLVDNKKIAQEDLEAKKQDLVNIIAAAAESSAE